MASRTLKIGDPPGIGMKTNIPFHSNQKLAKSKAITPSEITRMVAKITPVTHLMNSSRNREIGRERIMRNVPSSASLATRSPPTSMT